MGDDYPVRVTRVEILVTYSEPMDSIDADALANYSFIEAGPNGALGDGDDQVFAFEAYHVPGSAFVTLDIRIRHRRLGE